LGEAKKPGTETRGTRKPFRTRRIKKKKKCRVLGLPFGAPCATHVWPRRRITVGVQHVDFYHVSYGSLKTKKIFVPERNLRYFCHWEKIREIALYIRDMKKAFAVRGNL